MKVYGHQHSSEAFFRETSPSCFEPKVEKVIAFHGKDASYAYNVLADLKAAGASSGWPRDTPSFQGGEVKGS